ncbi:hypothetical protein MBLNU459_g7041t1 [Dothideomycetes sp. NU459]
MVWPGCLHRCEAVTSRCHRARQTNPTYVCEYQDCEHAKVPHRGPCPVCVRRSDSVRDPAELPHQFHAYMPSRFFVVREGFPTWGPCEFCNPAGVAGSGKEWEKARREIDGKDEGGAGGGGDSAPESPRG